MLNMQNTHKMQNMTNMQNIQNMQNNQNMSNMLNMLNMQNMHKNAVLVHKIVYLALRPLFLVPGVAKAGASSSSRRVIRACGPRSGSRSRRSRGRRHGRRRGRGAPAASLSH